MPFEKYTPIDYVTPAFPGGHRAQAKTRDQIEQDRDLRAEHARDAMVLQALVTLTSFEGWDSYTGQLSIIEAQLTEELVQTPGGNDYVRGFIMGLRKAVHLPAELAQRSKTL